MISAIGISGTSSRESHSRRLLTYAAGRLENAGLDTRVIDLCELPADGLLGRTRSMQVSDALDRVAGARIVVVSTPVYRAAYSGLLKVFFDLLPQDALAHKVAIPIATGASPGHQLVIDHALRPLLASVGAVVVAAGVYGTDSQFRSDDGPDDSLIARVEQVVAAALELVRVWDENVR